MSTSLTSGPESAVPNAVKKDRVFGSYARSFLWIATLFAVILSFSNITELLFVDFVYGNPHRPQSNAIVMMLLYIPIFAVIASIGCFLVFGLPLLVQATLHALLVRSGRAYAYLAIIIFLPVMAVLTWYCWEYLTPTDFNLGVNEGADWQPYQHGINLRRYMLALAFQAPVCLSSLIYVEPKTVGMTRKTIVFSGIAIAALIGIVFGHHQAEQQYKFSGQARREQVAGPAPSMALLGVASCGVMISALRPGQTTSIAVTAVTTF